MKGRDEVRRVIHGIGFGRDTKSSNENTLIIKHQNRAKENL